jgi:hypothetical protein
LVYVVAALMTASSAHAQAVRMVGRPDSAKDGAPTVFTRTPDGSWRTTVAGPDGVAREYVYVPPTGVKPMVRTSLGLRTDGTPLVTYRYTVTNSAGATQALARFLLMAVHPVSARDVPAVWTSQSSVSGVIFSGQLADRQLTGVPPGETVQGPVLEGSVLPGVILARTMGNPPRTGPPPGLSEAQRDDLLKLSRTAFVDLHVIGPAIPMGAREPELGFDAILRSVADHYQRELTKASHPDAERVRAIFAAMPKDGVTSDDAAVRRGLGELLKLGPERLTDAWHRQLSEALAVCTRALMSGSVPVRAAVPQ